MPVVLGGGFVVGLVETGTDVSSVTAPEPHTHGHPREGESFSPRAIPVEGWAAGALVALAIVWLFKDWIWTQHLISWDHPDDWGHAYVIPLISGYLVWRRRKEIAERRVRTFWPAVVPLLLGIVCYVFFTVGAMANHMLQAGAIVLTIGATALMLLGPAMFRLLVLPIAFLFMASTFSERLMILVTFPLQLLASQGAWLILSLLSPLLGYEVLVSGNRIEMITSTASIPLDVAEQCSGMRMVVAFLALAMAFALVACPRWWERIAMFLLAVPVAIFMNVVRVAALGLASLIDPNLANGQAHMLIGTLLLIPALGLYMLGHWMLGRLFIDPAKEAQRKASKQTLVKRASGVPGGTP